MAATSAAADGGSGVLGSVTTFGCCFCWTTAGSWQLVDLGGNWMPRDCGGRADGGGGGSWMNCEVGCNTPHGVVVMMILRGNRDARLEEVFYSILCMLFTIQLADTSDWLRVVVEGCSQMKI